MARIIAKTLPCHLSDKEVASRTQDLLILMTEFDTEAEAEKDRRKEWKNEQDDRKKKVDELRGQISSRVENRAVRCEERRNDQLKTMDIIRLDDRSAWADGTDIVNSRPLSPSELQIELIADHRREREESEANLQGVDVPAEGGEQAAAEVDPFEGTEDEDEEEGEEPEAEAAAPAPEEKKKSKRGKAS